MPSLSERIYKLLHAHWQAEKAGCECGPLTGRPLNLRSGGKIVATVQGEPCPSCAAIDELIRKWCWHEQHAGYLFWGDHDKESKHLKQTDMQGVVSACPCGHIWWQWFYSKPGHFYAQDPCVKFPYPNPNLTTHLTGTTFTVLVMLQDVGLWERWNDYLYEQTFGYDHEKYGLTVEDTSEIHTEILTNGEYLCQSVESFLREVNK